MPIVIASLCEGIEVLKNEGKGSRERQNHWSISNPDFARRILAAATDFRMEKEEDEATLSLGGYDPQSKTSLHSRTSRRNP